MSRLLAGFWLFILLCGNAVAAPEYPALTGRVVDNAHVMAPGAAQLLDRELAAHESRTSDQVVVVTLPSLGGQVIEDYSVALSRHWQIGQKGKNNGVLLLIAVQEHEARIEVGYGLEGQLTDAISRRIIEQVIIPEFHKGDMQSGIMGGAHAILHVLGDSEIAVPPEYYGAPQAQGQMGPVGMIFIIIGILILIAFCIRHPDIAWLLLNIAMSSGRNSGGGGGGFSGGGGSFGGGGASGKW